MSHVIEPASSGRAKCRGCGERIASGELRFGERLPNPYADDDDALMTHWFHVTCAAYSRPEAFLEATAAGAGAGISDLDALAHEAALGVAHRRLPRVRTAARAPSGRARCRACKESIAKKAWRIALVFYEDGRFNPSGYIHATCAKDYLETTEIIPRLRHFSPDLEEGDVVEIRAEVVV